MFGQGVESPVALSIDSILVRDHVLIKHPAVCADLVARDFAALQQLHQIRAGDVEHIRSFLRRKSGMDRSDAHRVVFANLGQDVHQQA